MRASGSPDNMQETDRGFAGVVLARLGKYLWDQASQQAEDRVLVAVLRFLALEILSRARKSSQEHMRKVAYHWYSTTEFGSSSSARMKSVLMSAVDLLSAILP